MKIMVPESCTVREFIELAAETFQKQNLCFGHGTANAHDEALAFVLHVTQQPFETIDEWLEEPLSPGQRQSLIDLSQRRLDERVPAAYLTGEAWFAGHRFGVTPDVLVPRSPFAELIDDGFQPWLDLSKVERILDVCSGSACIAIACAHAFPDVKVDAIELSPAACKVAAGNIGDHQLTHRVQLIQSDLFDGLESQHYQLIVSNPPYVSHAEMAELPAEYQAEPSMGFDGGEDGLSLVHRLLAEAPDYLDPGGLLYVEVGSSAETLQSCYPQVPFLWQEFDCGGDGIFMLTREQLLDHQAAFEAYIQPRTS